MTVWEDIYSAIDNFWNWITSTISEPVSDFMKTLGGLGAWLFGGLKWLADQLYNAYTVIHNALVYFADVAGNAFENAWSFLSTHLKEGLSYIGSGISWLGQHIYSLGQWIWNGISYVGHLVVNGINAIITWIYQHLSGLWNGIAGLFNSWITGMNDYLNELILSFREKLAKLITVQFTFAGVEKSFNLFGRGKFKEGALLLLGSPFLSLIGACIIDTVTPRPQSQRVIFFPEIQIPEFNVSSLTIVPPSEPTPPNPSPTNSNLVSPISPIATSKVEVSERSTERYNVEIKKSYVTKTSESSKTSVSYSIFQNVSKAVSEKSVTSVSYSLIKPTSESVSEKSKVSVIYELIVPQSENVSEKSKVSVSYKVVVPPSTSVTEKSKVSVSYKVITPPSTEVPNAASVSFSVNTY